MDWHNKPIFFGELWPMARETVRWVWRALPLIFRDWKLIRRMMAGGNGDMTRSAVRTDYEEYRARRIRGNETL
jgi:hypothetical protein